MIDGLAFLPINDVAAGMAFLKTRTPEAAEPIITYFDETYVTGTYRNVGRVNENPRLRRIPPRFPPELWNVHDITLQGGDRTNNFSEAWNRRLGCLVGHSHPSVWRALEALRLEHATVEGKIALSLAGNPPQKRLRASTLQLQDRLRHICEEYAGGQTTMEQFLRGVGYNVSLSRKKK